MGASAEKKSWAYRRRGVDEAPSGKKIGAVIVLDEEGAEKLTTVVRQNVLSINRNRTQILMNSFDLVMCDKTSTSALLAWLNFYARYVR